MASFDQIIRLPEFERELKSLTKRFRSLPEDLQILIDSPICLYHKQDVDNRGIAQISNLGDLSAPVFKVTKFACQAFKGRGAKTGLRLIYAYFEQEDRVELIEIYFKGDKAKEDRDRIMKHYSVQ